MLGWLNNSSRKTRHANVARTANIVEIMLYISQQMKCTLQTSCVIRVALNVAAAPEIDFSCASARHRKEKARGLAVLHKREDNLPDKSTLGATATGTPARGAAAEG